MKQIRFHPDALREAEAAVAWYRARSHQAAERFLDELADALNSIRRSPGRFMDLEFGARRLVLRRFPFVISFSRRAKRCRDRGDSAWPPASRILGVPPPSR